MGLDAVEIVLRTEELFGIAISDEEAGGVRTVGDFYQVICGKVGVVPLASPVTSERLPVIHRNEKAWLFGERQVSLPAPTEVLPWSPQSVWDCVVAVFVDQLGVRRDDVTYQARINEDLRVD